MSRKKSLPKSHVFDDIRYRLKDQSGLPEGKLGECNYEKKTLYILLEGNTLEDLDVIIHEGLHAACPLICEYYINIIATTIAKLLWRLGWRKTVE